MNRRDVLKAGLSLTALTPAMGWMNLLAHQQQEFNNGDGQLDHPDRYKNLPADAPTIAMVIYEGFTVLDLIGPYQFLWALMDRRVRIVAKKKGPITADTGIQIIADTTFEECPKDLDVLFVGGGTEGTLLAMQDEETRKFFADRGKRANHIVSVCTGSLILGAAGLLKGKEATGHFAARDLLSEFGAKPVNKRTVEDGNIMTGAGVSAGLDLGLALLAKLGGEDYAKLCQLFFEYDPNPMFDYGSPEKAKKEDVDMSIQMVEPFREAVKKFAREIRHEKE
ncbi:DJ-1/PfpI family protein [bacterium]|nr:DJ-1/PfpI family protein [bacterium]